MRYNANDETDLTRDMVVALPRSLTPLPKSRFQMGLRVHVKIIQNYLDTFLAKYFQNNEILEIKHKHVSRGWSLILVTNFLTAHNH